MTAQPSPAHEAVDCEKLLVHNRRVTRLTGLGIPGALAKVNAGLAADSAPHGRPAGLRSRDAAPRGWPCASSACR